MNYLAHLYLSPPDDDALLGSLLGDFVKGPLAERYAGPVARGIMMHRRLDSFTDAHPVVRASKARVPAKRRRYAGIMVDVFYDHYLARDWTRYHDEPLAGFAARVYRLLERRRGELPERLQAVAARMTERNWLCSYADPGVPGAALARMAARLRRGAEPLAAAGEDLRAHYAGFEADFRSFMPQARSWARDFAHDRPAVAA